MLHGAIPRQLSELVNRTSARAQQNSEIEQVPLVARRYNMRLLGPYL